jgi:hypothetical protein
VASFVLKVFRKAGIFIGVNGRAVVSTDSFIEIGDYRQTRYDRSDLRRYFEEIESDGRTSNK